MSLFPVFMILLACTKTSDRQIQLAYEWLALLGFSTQTAQQPFHSLSGAAALSLDSSSTS